MLQNLKFPLLYILEGLLAPLPVSGFFVSVSFLVAKPVKSLDLHGKALPTGWEAAVPNHGGYYEWVLVANHPILFAAGLALLLAPGAALYQIRKAQVLQREQATMSSTAHSIARVFPMATFALAAYWFVFHVAAIIKPA